MANPSGDVYEDIAELYRIVEGLASAARMPQYSADASRLQAVADDSGITSDAPAAWGDLSGGAGGLTIGARVPVSGKILVSFGAYLGAKTTASAFGLWENVAMGVLVKGGPDGLVPPATTLHLPQISAAYNYVEGTATVSVRSQVSVAGSFVLDCTGYDKLQLDAQFIANNKVQSAATYVLAPWMHCQPL